MDSEKEQYLFSGGGNNVTGLRHSLSESFVKAFSKDDFTISGEFKFQPQKTLSGSNSYNVTDAKNDTIFKQTIYGKTYQTKREGYNLIKNGDFKDGTTNWNKTAQCNVTELNGIKYLKIYSETGGFTKIYQQLNTTANNKYYVAVKIIANNMNIDSRVVLSNDVKTSNYPTPCNYFANKTFPTETTISSILSPPNDNAYAGIFVQYSQGHNDLNNEFYFRDFICVDLTEKYGSGNEPTLEECNKLFLYEPYGVIPSIDYKSDITGVGDNKNLLGIKDNNFSSLGLNVKVENEEIIINGTVTSSGRFRINELIKDIKFDKDNDYVFSIIESGNKTKNLDIDLYDESISTKILTRNTNSFPYKFNNISGTVHYMYMYVAEQTVFTDYRLKLKIEKGVKPTSYSKFGYSNIDINQLGKNLFDDDKTVKNSIGITKNNRTYIFTNITTIDSFAVRIDPVEEIEKGKTYTLSCTVKNTGQINAQIVTGYGWCGNGWSTLGTVAAGKTERLSITKVAELASYHDSPSGKRVILGAAFSNGASFEISNIQLEEGTELTEYEIFKENNYCINIKNNKLYSIDDIKDDITINGTIGKITKKIEKIILDSNTILEYNWTDNKTNTYRFDIIILNDGKRVDRNKIMCDKFISKYGDDGDYEHCRNGSYVYSNILILYINKSRLVDTSTVEKAKESFKTWLQENPITIYYELESPKTIYLDNIQLPTLYDGVNDITINTIIDSESTIIYNQNSMDNNKSGTFLFQGVGPLYSLGGDKFINISELSINEYKKFSITSKLSDISKDTDTLCIRTDKMKGLLYLRKFQAEKGNKPSDWSPNLKDTLNDIKIGTRNLLKNSNSIELSGSDQPLVTKRELGKITVLDGVNKRGNAYQWIDQRFSVKPKELNSIKR